MNVIAAIMSVADYDEKMSPSLNRRVSRPVSTASCLSNNSGMDILRDSQDLDESQEDEVFLQKYQNLVAEYTP